VKRSWSDLVEEILQSQTFQGRTGRQLLLALLCVPVVLLCYLVDLICRILSR